MRVLHLNARAGHYGGVEQILGDIATSLGAAGDPQALLHADSAPDPGYLSRFQASGAIADDTPRLLSSFQPDCVLIHKLDDSTLIERLAAELPTARMVHDHDLVCLRRHKYFPLSTAICNEPAGSACYRHLCFIQRAASEQRMPMRLTSLKTIRQGLDAHRSVRRFIVGSHWMSEELAMNGIDRARISILPPVPSSLAEVRSLPASAVAEILFVGQVIRGKGVDLLLRALAKLERPWHATIVGVGNHLEQCRALAARLEIADRVDFTGWVDHRALDNHYQRAMLSVVPSRWPEPFGMVGVEAMARGRPVVGFAAGGIPDWLDDGVTGLLAPPADTGALAERIDRLLGDPALRHRLGAQAAERVQTRYQPAQFIDALRKLLGQLDVDP